MKSSSKCSMCSRDKHPLEIKVATTHPVGASKPNILIGMKSFGRSLSFLQWIAEELSDKDFIKLDKTISNWRNLLVSQFKLSNSTSSSLLLSWVFSLKGLTDTNWICGNISHSEIIEQVITRSNWIIQIFLPNNHFHVTFFLSRLHFHFFGWLAWTTTLWQTKKLRWVIKTKLRKILEKQKLKTTRAERKRENPKTCKTKLRASLWSCWWCGIMVVIYHM